MFNLCLREKQGIMELYEAIDKRRSIRQFEDRAIPRDVLERILNAGLKAPSSNHQRQWELVALTDRSMIQCLAKLVKPYPCSISEPRTPQQEMFKIAYPRQRSMIEGSACVVLPYFKCNTTSKARRTTTARWITARPGRLWRTSCLRRRRRGWAASCTSP